MKSGFRLDVLGPGLLYAAAAVGVSHIVQSTRAGANFGTQLIWAVVIANFLKYPFFRIGPKYTAITGKSLLAGYKRLGNWAVYLFICLTLGTMFTVQSAVTVVTAGLADEIFGFALSIPLLGSVIILLCMTVLMFGKYNIIDYFIKVIIIILSITTVCSVAMALAGEFPKFGSPTIFSFDNKSHIFFLIALIGWMPAPMDVPVWHSMWTIAKDRENKTKTTLPNAMTDFNIGYIGTAILAISFLLLGSIVMYDSGMEFSPKAGVFAGQLINMYTEAIGSWAYPVIAVAALTTMLSTTLTCLDAFPRILREAFAQLNSNINPDDLKLYRLALIIVSAGAIYILNFQITSMRELIDFATTLSFIVAPIFALLNYLTISGKDVPKDLRPSGAIRLLSLFGFVFLCGFSIWFIYLKFLS